MSTAERNLVIEKRFKADWRRCLKCGNEFWSEWAGNRRCPACEQALKTQFIPKPYADFEGTNE